MQLNTFVVLWSCLATIVLALALVRYIVSLHEDDNIHLKASEEAVITNQIAFLHTLGVIDRWGKSLTIAAFSTGLVLLGVYLYRLLPA